MPPKYDHKTFFDGFKDGFDDSLNQDQVDGIEFLLSSFENDLLWDDVRHIAYALATIYHETAGSMQPVEEGYYLGSPARVRAFQKTLRYYPYFGRGYVQLTWNTKRIPNYQKASDALGIDFVTHPNLVMVPENAFQILTLGMHEGWFTTKKLSNFIHGARCDYKDARTIINGHDKAALIAGYAQKFEGILNKAAGNEAPAGLVSVEQTTVQSGGDTATATTTTVQSTDNISLPAPDAMGSVQKTATVTILGIGVPPAIIAFFQLIGGWFKDGTLDAKAAFDLTGNLLRQNMKYITILLAMLIGMIMLKKVERIILFGISMLTTAIPTWNSIKIVAPEGTVNAKWWQVWK